MSPASRVCALLQKWYRLVIRRQRISEAEASTPSWRRRAADAVRAARAALGPPTVEAFEPRLMLDSSPTVTIVATDDEASETSLDPAVFEISRDLTGGPLAVGYTVSGTSETGDISETLSGTVTIPDGELSTTITVTPIDDGDFELIEELTISLDSGTGYLVGSADAATVDILDNDPPGAFDTGFGDAGSLSTTDLGYTECGQAVAVQADGKVVVAGYGESCSCSGYDFVVARYNTDLTLDATFGTGGVVYTDIEYGYDYARSVAIQSDGKIVVAGHGYSCSSYGEDFAVVRYLADGQLDSSFGSGGIVMTDLGGMDYAHGVAIQSDGKVVVAGYSQSSCSCASDFAAVRYNADGSLDTSFDTDGIVTTDLGGYSDRAYGVAIQSDGKVVLGGQTDVNCGYYDFAAVRYDSNGSLDTAFDGDGTVVTTASSYSYDYGRAVAVQSDGKILLAGYTDANCSGYDFAVIRYGSDGQLDTSFDTDGIATTHVGPDTYDNDYAQAVAVRSDGSIVVAGYTETCSCTYEIDFATVRYTSTGALDTAFDADGIVTTDFQDGDDYGQGLAVESDGAVVAAGYSCTASGYDFAVARLEQDGGVWGLAGLSGATSTHVGDWSCSAGVGVALDGGGRILVGTGAYSASGGYEDFVAAAYDSIGGLDATFATNGVALTDLGGYTYDYGYGVAVQSDGKVLVAGSTQGASCTYDFALIRYTAAGALDTAFGTGGIVTTDFGGYDYAYDLAIQSDGKILLAGYTDNASCGYDFALSRYTSGGVLDTAFGTGGIVTTDFGGYDYACDLAIQSDGKIVLAGQAGGDAALARYLSDGTLDTTFGTGGRVTTDAGGYDAAYGVAIQSDGKVVIAGQTDGVTCYSDTLVARYTAGGQLDTSFDTDGIVTSDPGGYYDYARAVVVQSDGKIAVAGYSDTLSCTTELTVVRYGADGSPDATFGNGGVVLKTVPGGVMDVDLAEQSDRKLVASAVDYNAQVTVMRVQGGSYPAVEISGDSSAIVGQTYTLDLSATGAGVESLAEWRIDWGDGVQETVTAPASQATHVYTTGPATPTIQARAVFGDGVWDSNALAVTVGNPAFTPTITISGDAGTNEGDTYTLTLSATDLDGHTVTQWDVDWGDGSAVETLSGTATQATHVYADGSAAPTIVATALIDGVGYDSNNLPITVANVAPTLDASGAASVNEGATYTLALSATDPGADTISQWDIDWGDGSAVETLPGTATQATHVYADGPNSYTIQADATDEDGTYSAAAVNVTVDNVAPVVSLAGAPSVELNATYTLNLSATDAGADAIGEWRIDWGDGSAIDTLSGTATEATHTYTVADTYTISVDADDEDGATSSATHAVTAYDPAAAPLVTIAATDDEASETSLDPAVFEISRDLTGGPLAVGYTVS